MDMEKVASLARMLIDAHGAQAELAAARRQAEAEKKGDAREAEDWKRIRAAIVQTKGPRST
jgi:hypothetical protein